MRQNGERVYGPYPHRSSFRIIVVGAAGERKVETFPTESAAHAFKTKLLKQLAGRTVSEAVQEHVVDMRERGLRSTTVARAEYHLRSFFQLDEKLRGQRRATPYARAGGALEELGARRCEELYTELRKTSSVDTHQNSLNAAKAFGAWCVAQSWIRENPLDGIAPIGQRNRGKPQLRLDEARRLVELCVKMAKQGDEGAVAVLTAFLLGLRASEVTDRVVRDLDDGGRLLWVEFGKTRRSRRTLEVPTLLQPFLLELAAGRPADAQLITRGRTKRGGRRDRQWVRYHVERLCKAAGVPDVCAHSLRGLHATLAADAGATSHLVAAALGHTSSATTEAHYIQPGTTKRARSRRVAGKVGATTPATPTMSIAPGSEAIQ